MNSAEIVAAVQSQAGVDVTAAAALDWVNGVYREAVARAQYLLTEAAIGTTVAGTASYVLPSNAVDVRDVTVGGQPYELSDVRTVYRLNQGTLEDRSSYGYFAADFDATGNPLIVLYPTPTASGTAISGLVAIEPTALDGTSGTSPVTPIDTHQQLVDLAAELGVSRQDNDPGAAQQYQQGLQGLADQLSRRRVSRVGSGSVQLPIRGYHYA